MKNISFQENFPYLYRGIVVTNKDPKNLGRCRVRVPSIHGGDEIPESYLPWARRVSDISINENRGNSSVPDIGDIVWVLFEGGDTDYPVYLGGVQGSKDSPVSLDEVVLYQEGSDRIVYNRLTKSFSISVRGNKLSLSSDIDILSANNINIKGTVNISGSLILNGKVI